MTRGLQLRTNCVHLVLRSNARREFSLLWFRRGGCTKWRGSLWSHVWMSARLVSLMTGAGGCYFILLSTTPGGVLHDARFERLGMLETPERACRKCPCAVHD